MAGNAEAAEAAEIKKQQAVFEKKVKEAIRLTKEETKATAAEGKNFEVTKFNTYWGVGKRLNELTSNLSKKERVALVNRFRDETSMPYTFYNLAVNFHKMLTMEQVRQIIKNDVSVSTIKAVLGDRKMDDKRRAQLIKQACEKGLSRDDIRNLRGAKGVRRSASSKRNRANGKKLKPIRVFTKMLDRTLMLSETVGIATDAVGRMENLTDKDLKETTKELVRLRDKVDDLIKIGGAFLKFTANVSKQKADS